ncbi:hypothetical protein AvCA_04290 [Azotobacter vinelandii CA]|uniref:Uncharacterized protein n=2 Tax=Azotobacter vinelandii TaxID=354 RepID=C1DJA0_AZOVD|nr:hypothetical protein Avin_04290 [Azotobacter vinelandii DJ]AGK17302.1 hypothetical protein AvCA_04290 [Azotobacter vinelandii CA]AGK19293.1 hypothetical protein AvCA6_04290 [Azotobacter vinelandii CA6]
MLMISGKPHPKPTDSAIRIAARFST